MNALAIFSAPICAAASLCFVLAASTTPVLAADAAAAKPAAQAAPKAPAKAKPAAKSKKAAPAALALAAATDEQRSVAERVYYGAYECDFKQVIHITASEKHPAYVDLSFGKASYLMKPVMSSTGAVRLEDVKGQTLMIQIASKSMLMNVKTGSRLVDECVSHRQRLEIEAAKQAAALEAQQAATDPSAGKPAP